MVYLKLRTNLAKKSPKRILFFTNFRSVQALFLHNGIYMKKLIGITLLVNLIGFVLYATATWIQFYFPSCEQKTGTQLLAQYPYHSAQYDAEAKELLKDSRIWKNTYFFVGFEQKADKKYMLVHCEGENFCGTIPFLLRHEVGLENIRKTNGTSYHNANLHKLQWRVEEHDGKEEIVFDGLHCIVD